MRFCGARSPVGRADDRWPEPASSVAHRRSVRRRVSAPSAGPTTRRDSVRPAARSPVLPRNIDVPAPEPRRPSAEDRRPYTGTSTLFRGRSTSLQGNIDTLPRKIDVLAPEHRLASRQDMSPSDAGTHVFRSRNAWFRGASVSSLGRTSRFRCKRVNPRVLRGLAAMLEACDPVTRALPLPGRGDRGGLTCAALGRARFGRVHVARWCLNC